LPIERKCPVSFIKDIFCGKKKYSLIFSLCFRFFYTYEVTQLKIPHYKELAVCNVFDTFRRNRTVMGYMLDYSGKELPDRDFLYGILATIYPDETKNLIEGCRKNRAIISKEDKGDLIEMTEEIEEEIMSLLAHPSKYSLKFRL
jgi:hypothetical protein